MSRYPSVQLAWLKAERTAKVTVAGDGFRPDAFGITIVSSQTMKGTKTRLARARVTPEADGKLSWAVVVTAPKQHRFILVVVRKKEDDAADCAKPGVEYTDEADELPVCLLVRVRDASGR